MAVRRKSSTMAPLPGGWTCQTPGCGHEGNHRSWKWCAGCGKTPSTWNWNQSRGGGGRSRWDQGAPLAAWIREWEKDSAKQGGTDNNKKKEKEKEDKSEIHKAILALESDIRALGKIAGTEAVVKKKQEELQEKHKARDQGKTLSEIVVKLEGRIKTKEQQVDKEKANLEELSRAMAALTVQIAKAEETAKAKEGELTQLQTELREQLAAKQAQQDEGKEPTPPVEGMAALDKVDKLFANLVAALSVDPDRAKTIEAARDELRRTFRKQLPRDEGPGEEGDDTMDIDDIDRDKAAELQDKLAKGALDESDKQIIGKALGRRANKQRV